MSTSTKITPEVIEQVANLFNEFAGRDNPRDSFRQFVPGILATSLYVHVADCGRRYDIRQMMAILELAEPQIALSKQILKAIRRDWVILGVYGDVMRGDPHPMNVQLTNASLSGRSVVPEIQRIFKEMAKGETGA